MSGQRESCDYLALQGTYRAVTRATVSVWSRATAYAHSYLKAAAALGETGVYF
jgi:hypothetical protein